MNFLIQIFIISKVLSYCCPQLQLYAQVDFSVGNIAYTNQGKLVFSTHPVFEYNTRVMSYDEITKKTAPFPNLEWNQENNQNEDYFSTVLGIRNDHKGIIWILDMGFRNNIRCKIVGWNTITNQLQKIYYVDAVHNTSQPNDFIIDYTHNVFIIADQDIANGGDATKASLIVVDMNTQKSWRVFQGHPTTLPEKQKPIVVKGTKLDVLVGADCITADSKDEWLYYAPLNGGKIYRIKIQDLISTQLNDSERNNKIEIYAKKENNGGLSMDEQGNFYMTYIQSNSIGLITAQSRQTYRFVSHQQMLWPDGTSYNKDGYYYVSASQVHLAGAFNDGTDKSTKPYYIFRFKPISPGYFGR